MLLFAIGTNLGYPIFTNSNKKIHKLVCQDFHKIICHRSPTNLAKDWEMFMPL